jgi:hypothetical protein
VMGFFRDWKKVMDNAIMLGRKMEDIHNAIEDLENGIVEEKEKFPKTVRQIIEEEIKKQDTFTLPNLISNRGTLLVNNESLHSITHIEYYFDRPSIDVTTLGDTERSFIPGRIINVTTSVTIPITTFDWISTPGEVKISVGGVSNARTLDGIITSQVNDTFNNETKLTIQITAGI